jgi:hypothetical protein
MAALVLTIALALSAAVASITPAHAQRRCHAIDGDTLACGSERVRIMGLDTPEMRGQCPAEISAARAAKDRLRSSSREASAWNPMGATGTGASSPSSAIDRGATWRRRSPWSGTRGRITGGDGGKGGVMDEGEHGLAAIKRPAQRLFRCRELLTV